MNIMILIDISSNYTITYSSSIALYTKSFVVNHVNVTLDKLFMNVALLLKLKAQPGLDLE